MSEHGNLDGIAAQRFSGATTRALGNEAGYWTQVFSFSADRQIDATRLATSAGPDHSLLDSFEFHEVLKVGPAEIYAREFVTNDEPLVVADRILGRTARSRQGATLPMALLPSPEALLNGGVTSEALEHVLKFGDAGATRFADMLDALTGNRKPSDSAAYWRGWLIVQGESAPSLREHPDAPDDDSWDPRVGESVVMFANLVRQTLRHGNRTVENDLTSMPAPSVPIELNRKRLEAGASRAGFSGDSAQDAWYRAELNLNRYAAHAIYREDSRFTEVVSYFCVRPGVVPNDELNRTVTRASERYGTPVRSHLHRIDQVLNPVHTAVLLRRVGRFDSRRSAEEYLYFSATPDSE